MGFSLEEIRDLYEDDTHVPTIEALEEKIRVCEEELRQLNARKAQLKAMVATDYENFDISKFTKITVENSAGEVAPIDLKPPCATGRSS